MSDKSDADYFFSTYPGKVVRSKRLPDKNSGRDLRIVSQIIETSEEVKFTVDLSEVTIRVTPAGRQQIKATFFEDNREIRTLTIQRYEMVGSYALPSSRVHFSFQGDEILRIKKFLASIESMNFEDESKSQVSERDLNDLILGRAQAQQLMTKNSDLFAQIFEHENWEKDIVALGYRRNQLKVFENLLTDESYFKDYCAERGLGPEAAWQDFFERNQWIFGYGLSYQFLGSLDDRKLEQIVRGFSIDAPGKRTDGLMKTRGSLSALCFVEIKRHHTELLKPSPYRSGSWVPSAEVVGGISQLQATVRAAQKQFGDQFRPNDDSGNPTGELLSLVSPKSFLVVGSLSEFETASGPNMEKHSCFEDFRKSLNRPEVITFDELFHRASYIVKHA